MVVKGENPTTIVFFVDFVFRGSISSGPDSRDVYVTVANLQGKYREPGKCMQNIAKQDPSRVRQKS